MAQVIVEMTGDEAKLLRALQKVMSENTKVGDTFKQTGKAAKEAADQAVKEAQRVERANAKAAQDIYAEHKKMLDAKERESRQAGQKQEAIARQTAFAEVQAAIKAAEQEIAALEKVEARKRKQAETEKNLAAQSQTAMLSKVTGFVAGYASIQSAINLANSALRDQIELQKESLGIATEIAKSQAGATKNLTGLSAVQKAQVFAEAKKMQAEIGFSDQKYIVDAIGSGYSAGGDIEATKSAVRASAALSRNAPDELATISAGAIDLSRGSGITDAQKNLGFMLQVGAISRVEDPAALSRTLSPTISSGVSTVGGQNKQEASREIGALYSELNKYATDVKGMSTQTATTTLLAKMGEFFRTLPEERDKINAQVKTLEDKLVIDPVEQARLNRADFEVTEKTKAANFYKGKAGPKADDAQIDLQEAIARRDQLQKDVTLDDEEKLKLAKLRRQSQSMAGVVDSGTVFGRLAQFQQSPGLRDTFLENPFGEAAFQGGFRQALTGGSDVAKNIASNKNELSFDSSTYLKTVAEIDTLTPELRIGAAKAKEAGRKQLSLNDPSKVNTAQINEIAANALRENRRSGLLNNSIDYGAENFQTLGGGATSDPRLAGFVATANLGVRKTALAKELGEGNTGAAEKIKNIDQAILEITALVRDFVNPKSTEDRAKELKLMEEQNQLLRNIDAKGGGGPAAIRAQAEQAKQQ